ncbi:hypothetical protein CR513_29224, partial [Mucuna pruriens]
MQTFATTLSHPHTREEHPKLLRINLQAMLNTMYGTTHIYAEYALTRSHTSVFQNLRSSRSTFLSLNVRRRTLWINEDNSEIRVAISKRNEMPQQPMFFCKIFDVWGYRLHGAIPCSLTTFQNGWRLRPPKLMMLELFGMLKALISDQGSHFYNRTMAKILSKYGVAHRVATTYHPQTNDQPEVFNREIKKLLQNMANPNWND